VFAWEILPKLSAQRLSTRVAITGLIAAIIVAERRSKRDGSNGYVVARKQYPERACRESPRNNVCSAARHLRSQPHIPEGRRQLYRTARRHYGRGETIERLSHSVDTRGPLLDRSRWKWRASCLLLTPSTRDACTCKISMSIMSITGTSSHWPGIVSPARLPPWRAPDE
jgi:hypothetical protein